MPTYSNSWKTIHTNDCIIQLEVKHYFLSKPKHCGLLNESAVRWKDLVPCFNQYPTHSFQLSVSCYVKIQSHNERENI